MCLTINSGDKPQIATKDIVVYKLLNKVTTIDADIESLHGVQFSGIIETIAFGKVNCTGKISVHNNTVFLCTDDPTLDGRYVDDKFKLNFKYSWCITNSVKSVVVDGNELIKKDSLQTIYRDFNVNIGETYESELKLVCEYAIDEGLHSYVSITSAKDYISNSLYCDVVIAKCIIPAGSNYYIGRFDGCDSIASDKLKYVKLLKQKK